MKKFGKSLLAGSVVFIVSSYMNESLSARVLKPTSKIESEEIISEEIKPHYPKFSWDHVPVYVHFGKRNTSLTEQEIEFVAGLSDFVGLEKLHASRKHGSTEKGTAYDVRRLKEENPDLKALFYWNSFIHYGGYDANQEVEKHPDWLFRDAEGEVILKKETFKQYNILNTEFQEWWANIAQKALTDYACDGVFVDATVQPTRPQWMRRGWGDFSEEALQLVMTNMLALAKTRMGENSLLIYNGIRSQDGKESYLGKEFIEVSDGTNLEHLAAFNSQSKESIAEDIEMITQIGKSGKIVIVKGWPDPDFNWTNSQKMRQPFAQLKQEAIEKMDFSLACFLVAAQKYSYFCYSWGYQENHGSLVDYPQFHNKLGAPLGNAQRNGWEYERSFEHANVWVNIETKEVSIDWL